MKCIYCLEDKDIILFKKREHVMSEAFGRFKNSFVLHNTVCDECNEYFGNEFELYLARDTLEGILRYKHGIKKSKDFKSVGKRSQISIKIAEGKLKGAYAFLEYSETEGDLIINPLPQIGFLKKNNSEYMFFLLDQIPSKENLEGDIVDIENPVRGIVSLGCDEDKAIKLLKEKGFNFKNLSKEFKDTMKNKKDILCKQTQVISQKIYRSIAKIAFNYLTYWEGPDFVMHKDFNPIRNYIKYGGKPSFYFIEVSKKPIFNDESVEGKSRVGHIITIEWIRNKTSIFSQVSLTNTINKYCIVLAQDFTGERRKIERGHFFNLKNKEIYKLKNKQME